MKAQVTSLLGELQESQSRLESSRRERGELEMRWGLLGGSRGVGAPRGHPGDGGTQVPLVDNQRVPLGDPHWVLMSDPHWGPWGANA